MLTYTTPLIFNKPQDESSLLSVLEAQRHAWNTASKLHFGSAKNSIVELHAKFYRKYRDEFPETPSAVVIFAENEAISAYRSAKSNKHKLTEAPVKKNLSMRLSQNAFKARKGVFSIVSLGPRVKCKPYLYPKLRELLETYEYCDPLLFAKEGKAWIALTFKTAEPNKVPQGEAVGVDLGVRVAAVTSEGNFYRDKAYNGRKRETRYLKRQLQAKGTKSAKRHLGRLSKRERHQSKARTHQLANQILSEASAPVVVLENLTGIKKPKAGKFLHNFNRIAQVPLFNLYQTLTYKAPAYGKTVITVNPQYTSQLDHRTGKISGTRKGRRYYGADGIVLDADQNAAINIAIRSKHPVSYVTLLDGQAAVNRPNSLTANVTTFSVCHKLPTLVGGI